MRDDELDRMPLAAIPTTSPGQSSANDTTNLFAPVPSFSQQQTPPSASPVPKAEYQQTSTLDLTDDQLGALLLANCSTPPPFETINPSTLSSPGPVTDFSGSDGGLASAASSPFYPFNDDIGSTSISCPPTPSLPSLPAPVARRYSRIYNMDDSAFTEPHASPEGFPLVGQPSGPDEQSPHGLPTSSPQHVRQGHQHTYLHPQALMSAQSQSPQPVGSPHHQYAPFPTPPQSNSHPYPPALQQQALQQSPEPAQGEVAFHRQTGHYLGPPRIRHPYPPGAHIAPNAQDYPLLDQQRQQQQQQIQHMQNTQQQRQLLIQQQQEHLRQLQQHHNCQQHTPPHHQHSNPNIGLLTRGSVPIGTPMTPPPCSPTASTFTPPPAPLHPFRPASTTIRPAASTIESSPTPPPLFRPVFSPGPFSPGAPFSPAHHHSPHPHLHLATQTTRRRSNTAPTPYSSAARRATPFGENNRGSSSNRQAPYPSPRTPAVQQTPFSRAESAGAGAGAYRPLSLFPPSVRGVERATMMMAGKRRAAAAAGVRWFGGPDGHGQGAGGGPTSAPRQGEEGLGLGLGVGTAVAGDGGSGGDAVAGADRSGLLAREETLDSEPGVAEPLSEQDTAFSGMQGRLERLEREFEGLKDFVRAGQEEIRRDAEN